MRDPTRELARIERGGGVVDELRRVEVQVELAVGGHPPGRRGQRRYVGEQRQSDRGQQRRALVPTPMGFRLAAEPLASTYRARRLRSASPLAHLITRHGIAPKTPYRPVNATRPAPHAAIVNGHERS